MDVEVLAQQLVDEAVEGRIAEQRPPLRLDADLTPLPRRRVLERGGRVLVRTPVSRPHRTSGDEKHPRHGGEQPSAAG